MSEDQEQKESTCKVKERHTSHWDWDVMPREEIEAQIRAGRRRLWQRRLAWSVGTLLSVALAVVAGLVITGRAG